MNQYEKGILVMNYLRKLNMQPTTILEAICDENLEVTYQWIKDNPQITKAEFLKKMEITEEK